MPPIIAGGIIGIPPPSMEMGQLAKNGERGREWMDSTSACHYPFFLMIIISCIYDLYSETLRNDLWEHIKGRYCAIAKWQCSSF